MRALVLVDIQNDFLPGGALPVRNGSAVVPVANRVQAEFTLIVATQDWHPSGHGSFASSHPGKHVGDVIDLHGLDQVLWPDHCVQGAHGAGFAPGLDMSRVARVFQKGVDPQIDSYSGFFDNGHRRSTGLGDYLQEQGATSLYVMGLATDYCVRYTALDARKIGFDVFVIEDGCRGVDLRPGDSDAAIGEMRTLGIQIVQSADIASATGG